MISASDITKITDPDEAIAMQKQLASQVVRISQLGDINRVAGADVAIRGNIAKSAVVVLSFPELKVIESATAAVPVHFPYIPGLLSFREGPAIIKAVEKLRQQPEIIIFDGQGIAHPRRFGLASHMGVLMDMPTIGCAKTRFWGNHGALPLKKGSCIPLYDNLEIIGAVVRTRDDVKPVYVSIGHLLDLNTAIEIVLNCCKRCRLPETTRAAHHLANG
jgi:deoxyribonuclease V